VNTADEQYWEAETNETEIIKSIDDLLDLGKLTLFSCIILTILFYQICLQFKDSSSLAIVWTANWKVANEDDDKKDSSLNN
jgi:hypothetical protein